MCLYIFTLCHFSKNDGKKFYKNQYKEIYFVKPNCVITVFVYEQKSEFQNSIKSSIIGFFIIDTYIMTINNVKLL